MLYIDIPRQNLVTLLICRHSEDTSSLLEASSYTTGGSIGESMAEMAAEDMISALRAQRAALIERRAECQLHLSRLETEEMV